jgi:predicted nucleic acid-binding protein
MLLIDTNVLLSAADISDQDHIACASGEIPVVDLTTSDWHRCRDLIETYADLHLGIVDSSVVAERLGLSEIATLNHRDFRVVRPRHVGAFSRLPVR